MRYAFVILATTLFISAAAAADPQAVSPDAGVNALQPDNNDFPDYRAAEKHTLKEAFADSVIAYALVQPSFSNEYVVSLSRRRGAYTAFVVEADKQIWNALMFRSTTETAGAIRCEIPVPNEIAERVVQAWHAMLIATKPSRRMGLDGTIYDFGLRDQGKILTGQTWSPAEETNPYRLVMIVSALENACDTKSSAALSSIPSMADAIIAHVN